LRVGVALGDYFFNFGLILRGFLTVALRAAGEKVFVGATRGGITESETKKERPTYRSSARILTSDFYSSSHL